MIKTAKSLIGCLIAVISLSIPTHLPAADASSLINTAGMQRMLSQKITKAYFFLGQKVRSRKARKQIQEGMDLFRKNHQTLLIETTDPAIEKILDIVGITIDKFALIVQQPYGQDNAAQMLVLSDALLEMSQNVVEKIESAANLKRVAIVNISSRQRMLSQRMAKYYIAYQAGFQDQSVVRQLYKAVKQFEAAHKRLMSNKNNTPAITYELERVDRLWTAIRDFFLGIKKGGLPVTVFSTSDSILQHMDKVTTLYVELAGGAG